MLGQIMKIGTLTFHITSNYGALLQAYALQKILNRMGHSAEIVDYRYVGSENQLCTRLRDCRSLQRKKEYVKDAVWWFTGPAGYGRRQRILRCRDFIKTHIPVSVESFSSYLDLAEKALCYDAYITGSDQVWNPTMQETVNGAFRLEFVPEGRLRISYAASFGVPSLLPELSSVYGAAFRKFDFISVREAEGVQIVSEATDGKKAQIVLDPTMLLSQDDWLSISIPSQKHKRNGYILCYFLGEFEDSSHFIYQLQSHYKLPIVYIGFNKKLLFNPKIKLESGAGPREFLGLFAGAAHIVTNSFHGAVFSILFKKSFYSPLGTNTFRRPMNGRLSNLADMFNLRGRICELSEMKISEKCIDYDKIELLLDREREKSLNFLKISLKSSKS